MKHSISSGFRRGLNLECFDRACHLADFIRAVETRKNHFEIAIGKLAHCIAHRHDRPGDSAADRDGQQQHEQKLSDRQHFNQLFGLARGGARVDLNLLQFGKQCAFHSLERLNHGTGKRFHLAYQIDDRFGIIDEFRKRITVTIEHLGDAPHLRLQRLIAPRKITKCFLDESDARQRAVGDCHVVLCGEIVCGGRGRDKLSGYFRCGCLQVRKPGQAGAVGQVF
jgi:hypothetical protein